MLQESTIAVPTSSVTALLSVAGGGVLASVSFIVHLLIRILSKVNDLATHNALMDDRMTDFKRRIESLEKRRGDDYGRIPHGSEV